MVSSETESGRDHTHVVYFACKGACDRSQEGHYWRTKQMITGWQDIDDWAIPGFYLKQQMAILNGLREGDVYEEPAFARLKELLIAISQEVLRDMSAEEREHVRELSFLSF